MMNNIINAKKKIIVALDTQDTNHALGLISQLPEVAAFKLGLEYFCANGPEGFKILAESGVKIFLDLKFHDIPNTIEGAIRATLPINPFMMTVHISGGRLMLERAMNTVLEDHEKKIGNRPLIVGVSVLTSIDEDDFAALGLVGKLEDQVKRLADLALDVGLDGIVCSAKELKVIRDHVGKDLIIVTPGIRPKWAEKQDQKRIMSPAEAIKFGASFLVVGRPITEADNPSHAFEKLCQEIEE